MKFITENLNLKPKMKIAQIIRENLSTFREWRSINIKPWHAKELLNSLFKEEFEDPYACFFLCEDENGSYFNWDEYFEGA